jgi:2-iminoacetate synthase ThiH
MTSVMENLDESFIKRKKKKKKIFLKIHIDSTRANFKSTGYILMAHLEKNYY